MRVAAKIRPGHRANPRREKSSLAQVAGGMADLPQQRSKRWPQAAPATVGAV